MELTNGMLITRGKFSEAFSKLAGSTELDVKTKMRLIKVRRLATQHIDDLRIASEEVEGGIDLEEKVTLDVEQIQAEEVADILTADELMMLSGNILTEV